MKLNLAHDVTLTPTESGAVLLDGRGGRYWKLNGTGSAALRELLDGRSPEETAASLSAGAPVSGTRVAEDVQALIDALSAAKLVEVVP